MRCLALALLTLAAGGCRTADPVSTLTAALWHTAYNQVHALDATVGSAGADEGSVLLQFEPETERPFRSTTLRAAFSLRVPVAPLLIRETAPANEQWAAWDIDQSILRADLRQGTLARGDRAQWVVGLWSAIEEPALDEDGEPVPTDDDRAWRPMAEVKAPWLQAKLARFSARADGGWPSKAQLAPLGPGGAPASWDQLDRLQADRRLGLALRLNPESTVYLLPPTLVGLEPRIATIDGLWVWIGTCTVAPWNGETLPAPEQTASAQALLSDHRDPGFWNQSWRVLVTPLTVASDLVSGAMRVLTFLLGGG